MIVCLSSRNCLSSRGSLWWHYSNICQRIATDAVLYPHTAVQMTPVTSLCSERRTRISIVVGKWILLGDGDLFESGRTAHVTSEARAFCQLTLNRTNLPERLLFCERQALRAASSLALSKQGCFDNHNHGIPTCRLIDSVYHGCNLKTETASKYPRNYDIYPGKHTTQVRGGIRPLVQ
jgi:hypothetical protein